MTWVKDISLVGGAVIIVLVIGAIILNWGTRKPKMFRMGFFVEREYEDDDDEPTDEER